MSQLTSRYNGLAVNGRNILILVVTFTCLMLTLSVDAQSNLDTIKLKNGDYLVGEIKNMEKAVLQFETDYSDKDFLIDWTEVSQIHTNSFFLISLEDGSRLNGTFRNDPQDTTILRIQTADGEISTTIADVVFIKSVKTDFISRLSASIGIGVSLSKANNLRQFNARTSAGYTGNTWAANASFNSLISSQDSIARTRRTDASVGLQWFLPKDWFVSGSSAFLSNTEQKLKLRSAPQLGIGKYIVRNNNLLVSVLAGLAWNIERYEMPENDRKSLEGVFTGEANLFNTGDFSMLLSASAYPSITESGRFRSDITSDLKYEFPMDFYIKFGVTFNYDNRPVAGASETDYVIQWTVGWDL